MSASQTPSALCATSPQRGRKGWDLETDNLGGVANSTEGLETQIDDLVEEILNRRGMPLASQNETKNQNGQASHAPTQDTDTNDLETQIDDLVFDLYGLSEEERGVVLKNI